MEAIIRYILLFLSGVIFLVLIGYSLKRKKERLHTITEHFHPDEEEDHKRIFHEEILGVNKEDEPRFDLNAMEIEEDESEGGIAYGDLEDDEGDEEEEYDDSEENQEEDEEEYDDSEENQEEDEEEDDDLEEDPENEDKKKEEENPPSIFSITILASPPLKFEGYNLLQTILANRLNYGDMQIFHRHDHNTSPRKVLFSLASINKPGDFDLDKMGSFSCDGLVLFMNATNHHDPQLAFNEMLETATQLAEDLEGKLYSNANDPWSHEMTEKVKNQLRS